MPKPEPTFGEILRREREAAGMSVAKLALEADLSRQAVYDLESGKYRPTWDVVQAVATALNLPTDTFRG